MSSDFWSGMTIGAAVGYLTSMFAAWLAVRSTYPKKSPDSALRQLVNTTFSGYVGDKGFSGYAGFKEDSEFKDKENKNS